MQKGQDGGRKGAGKGGRGKGGAGSGSSGGGAPPLACALKFLTPEALAAAIIGKGGAVISALRTSCSARLQFTDHGDVFPGTESRVLTVQANTEDNLKDLVKQFVGKIGELAEGGTAADAVGVEGDLKIKTLVPRAAVGGVIGKGGASIKQMREDTAAKISINEPTGAGPGAEQLVAISGTAAALETVLLEINKQVQLLNSESWFSKWVTESSTFQAGTYMAPGGYGAGYGGHSPGMQTMLQVATGLPPYVTEDSRGFALSCVVPSHLVGGLIGRGGSGTKEVQSQTGTKINIRDIADDPDNRSMNIVGPLANTCAAYMLMMKRYLDAEALASSQS